eukprot:SRR837773.10919.p2 GENE.SRR837773.10919~~SRR837773.10919.p2  ORF type:complete len:244 (-),score=81.39 SRR837773.10919:212-853(-)
MGGLAFPTLESSDPNVPMLTPEQDAEVSKFSDQFVENAIKAFLGKTNLPPDEMKCIQDNSGQIGSNVGRIAEQLGLVVQKAFDVDLPFVPDAPVAVGGSVQAAPSSFDMSAFGSDDDAGAVGSIADKILRQSQAAPSAPVHAPAPVAAAPAPARSRRPPAPGTRRWTSSTTRAAAAGAAGPARGPERLVLLGLRHVFAAHGHGDGHVHEADHR